MVRILEDKDIIKLFRAREKDTHKGSFGTLLIIGGSRCYAGAAILAEAGAAALRIGSGIVRLAIPESLVAPLHARITETTIIALPELDGCIGFDKDKLEQALVGVTAVVCGCGLGISNELYLAIEWLIKNVKVPLLLDADALNILSQNVELLTKRCGDTVITPHLKEMARLTKIPSEEIKQNKIGIAKDFARKYNVTVLLKGEVSAVTDGEEVIENHTGTPAMAKGGSGDLLSGIIGGLMARKINVLTAASCGAYIAGKAAEMALQDGNEYSLLPSETAVFVAKWLTKLIKAYN